MIFRIELLDGVVNAIEVSAKDGARLNIIGLELLGIIGSPPDPAVRSWISRPGGR